MTPAFILAATAVGALVLGLVVGWWLSRRNAANLSTLMEDLARGQREEFGLARQEWAAAARDQRGELVAAFNQLGEMVSRVQESQAKTLAERLDSVTKAVRDMQGSHEQRAESLRQTVEGRLDALRTENSQKLDEMRLTVDEKLQGTLEERLGKSFALVNESLQNVYTSVGQMQELATGVGDLKRVLSNVKTRGTWGEVTLGNILEQYMTADQYGRNVEIKPGSRERVEYAIRIPGQTEADAPLWLPIDAKYPSEDFERLQQAADRADPEALETAAKALETSIKGSAREISRKYVQPPHSTDFGFMFLPTEGLHAEVLRRPGLVDFLFTQHRIVVAGPHSLMAMVSALQMGFRSLAIQKRSSEVWQVLGAVKTEFSKFGEVMTQVKRKLDEAQAAVGKVDTRLRVMDRSLKGVEALEGPVEPVLLHIPAETDGVDTAVSLRVQSRLGS